MNECYDFSASPTTVWLTVNRRCNFRCKWCYAKGSRYNPADDMSFDQAKKLVELVVGLGINHVTLTGGEPTLWPHLFAFNEYARSKGVTVSMITNACKFGDDKYWERYLKSPCDNVGVSIKGVTERQFVDVVGAPALLASTIKGIERAIKYHPKAGVGTVYSTLTSQDDVKAIAWMAWDLGAESFVISPCGVTVSDGVPSNQYVVEPKQLVKDIQELHGFLDELYEGEIVIEMSLPYCMWPQEFLDRLVSKGQLLGECSVQDRSGLVFDSKGNVLFCNNMLETCVAAYGVDFVDTASLMSHLNCDKVCGEYAEVLRYPADCCTVCSKKDQCRGGCNINWAILDPQELCHAV